MAHVMQPANLGIIDEAENDTRILRDFFEKFTTSENVSEIEAEGRSVSFALQRLNDIAESLSVSRNSSQ